MKEVLSESVAEAGTAAPTVECDGTAFGCPRNFLGNRFVYTVISARARGLTVGVNMNPDKHCDFKCVYCEVDRLERPFESQLDVVVMAKELERTLMLVKSGSIGESPRYRDVPAELLQLSQVTLSGDGEPTLAPNFAEGIEAVVHVRARGQVPFFKLVLITNASGLDRPDVVEGLLHLNSRDEIWAKLEAGTQQYMDRVNRPGCSIDRILANILTVARQRPIVIQSLFPSIANAGPPPSEVEAYAQRLLQLKTAGAQIQLVQIYSATSQRVPPAYRHLPLRALSAIARRVREVSGLPAEVF